jgi:hypothetical protein
MRPVEDYTAALLGVARRDEDLEGIPVFLALDDLTREGAASEDPGHPLGRVAAEYLDRQLAGREHATLDDVYAVLTVLGAHHFAPLDGEAS